MAEAGLIQLIESTKISKAFKEKLLVFGRGKDKETKVHEAELLKLRTDHERKNCELERKFMETNRLQEEESNKSKKAQLACKQLETKLEDSEEKCKTLQETLYSCKNANDSLARDVSSWEDQKLSFNHIIDKKDTEIKFITDEWNNTSKRLREVTDLKNDLQLKYDAISGSQANMQFRIKRIEEERDFLTEQNSLISLDLSRKTAELSALQREKASELSTLKTKFEIEMNQNKHLLETITNLKKSDGELHQQITNLQERITKETDDYHSMEGILRNELQAKTRLAELYSASADDNEKKSAELLSAVEELQSMIKPIRESNESFKLEAEKQRFIAEEEHKQVLKLTKELETANDLIESKRIKLPSEDELAQTHPIAALTAQSIKSGMTLTQMYSRIVDLDEEVDVTKMENKRLNEAMETVLQELQDKSPAILRLKRDYEQALMTVNKLTALQNDAVVEFQTLREETDDAVRKSNYLNRELERYKSESADQSRQITHLLKEVEEMRGRRVSMQSPRSRRRSSSTTTNNMSASLIVNDDGSCNDVSSSSELITSTLVTFKDIADLQDQNKKLLAVVRTLSNEQEKADRETSDERLTILQSELDEANDELERLRHDRKRQIELVNGIVRQRDMYKILLSQEQNVSASVLADPSHASFNTTSNKDGDVSTTANMTSSPIKSSPRSILTSPNRTVAQLRSEVEASKKMLKQQKDDSDHLKEELNANYKIVEKQLEEVKGNLSDERVTCAKIEAQLHFANERYQSMKKNMESYKKESDVYRTRYEDSNKLNGRLEQEISSLRSDCRNWQEQVSLFETKLEGQQRKLQLVTQSNNHMNAQNEKLKSELGNQREMLTNFRKSQDSMQDQEAVGRTRLNATLDSLQSERDSMSLRHQEELKSYQERTQGAEKQSLDLQNMRKADVENIRKLNKELMEAHQNVSALEESKSSIQLQLTNTENRLKHLTGDKNATTKEEDLTGRDSEVTVGRLQREIRQKIDEVASLETKIEKIKQSVDYYKEAATIAEDNLKKHNTENQVLLDRLQARLDMNSSHITELEQKIALLGEENAGLKNEKFTASDEMERKTNEVRKQMSLLQTEVETATKRMNEAINEAEKCRNDLVMQENRAEEANTKYQREVMHHSELMKELMELQETNKKNVNSIKDAEMKCRSLERVLQEKEQNWVSTEEQMKNDNEKDKQRIKDLESQNTALHENIQQVNNQLQQALSKKEQQQQQMMSPSGVRSSPRRPLMSSSRADQAVSIATAAAAEAETQSKSDATSTEKLLEVIRFLRREKDISTTECELKKSELLRLEMRLQHSEKQHKTSQEQYMQAQKIIEENQKQLTKLKIMEREVASHKAVQESNVSLRDERDSLTVDLRDANNKNSQLQAENAPLQTRTRELSLGNNALLTEKKMLKEEVERWKHRVEQITSSPRRAEPEETRRLMQEKQALLNKLDSTNRELAETKSEGSSLKGKIRSLEMDLQSTKSSQEGLQRDMQGKAEELEKTKKMCKEDKDKFIKVKNLARKFKSQLEEMNRTKMSDKTEMEKLKSELSNKEEEIKKVTEEKAAAAAVLAASTPAPAVGGDLNDSTTQTDQVESTATTATTASDQQQQTEGESTSASAGIQIEQRSEISALRASLEENKKQIDEKEQQLTKLEERNKKLNKFCSQARQQIEKTKKIQLETVKVAEGLKDEVKRLEEKANVNTELQNKLEDLQRQLIETRSTRPLSSKPPSVTAQPQPRKAVNVRPIGQQRVNQVPPYLRTARVIPEQREDLQDIAVTDRPGSAALPQVPSSSTQSTAVSASVQPTISTALVYPMSPARLQQQQQQQQQQPQQHVVSSGTPQQQTAAGVAASSSSLAVSTQQQQQHTVTHTQGTVLLQPTLPIPRFHDAAGSSAVAGSSSSAGNVGSSGTSTGAGSATTSSNAEAATSGGGSTDNEQAIVSSSDDQAMHEENRVNQPSSSSQQVVVVGAGSSSSNTSSGSTSQQITFGVFGSDTTASEVDPSSSATTTNLFAAASTSSPFDAAPSAEFVFGQTRSGLKRSREESSMDADQAGPSTRSTSSLWPSATSSNEMKGVAYPLAKKKRGCTAQDADQLQTNIFGERIPEMGQSSRHQQLTLSSQQQHGDNADQEEEEDNEVTMGDGCQREQEVAASSLDDQEQQQQEIESGELYEATVTSQLQQQHNDDVQVSASCGSEMVASSNQPSGAGDVIVLSSDSEDAPEDDEEEEEEDDDDEDQQPSQMREEGEIEDEEEEEEDDEEEEEGEMVQDGDMMVETSDQQQAGSSVDVVPSVPADEGVGMLRSAAIASSSSSSSRPIFSTRPPLLLPPDISATRLPPRHFRPGPLTPGMPMQTNEEADGVVPYTPTLLPQRPHDESYYPISSPRVPPQQISRFRFEDVSTAQPIAAVPAAGSEYMSADYSAAAVASQMMTTGGQQLSSTASSSGGNITSTSISSQQQSIAAPSTSPRHSTEIAAVSSSSIQEVEEEGGETEEDCMESEQVAGSSSSASSSSNVAAAGESSSTDQQSSNIPRSSIIKRGPRGFKLRVIGTSRNRSSNNPSSNSPSTSNQP